MRIVGMDGNFPVVESRAKLLQLSLHINTGDDATAMLLEARSQCNASQVQPDHISSIELLVERCTRTMFDMCKSC